MKRILLLSRDPGGTNAIIPLYNPLKAKGYDVLLYGKDDALRIYKNMGLLSINIIDSIKTLNLDTIELFLKSLNPDLIITGTSGDDKTEKYLWKAAEKLNIPSLAILDQWVNYGIRFSEFEVDEIDKYSQKKEHKFLPTKILLMDEIAKKEAINAGLPPEKLVVTGQPYFETLIKKAEILSKDNNVRSKLNINSDDLLITFASQPISEQYKLNDFGYNEITILDNLIKALNSFYIKNNIYLLIRPHPKEVLEKYDNFKLSAKGNLKIIVDNKLNQFETMVASDVICGMFSMIMIESVILNKPVISIQIGLNKDNPLILNRLNVLKSVLDYKELVDVLDTIIVKKELLSYNFDFIKDPVNRTIAYMENYLCKS